MAEGREDTPAMKTEYIPGVCNIGPAEIGRRRQIGWVGSGATILLWAAFLICSGMKPGLIRNTVIPAV